MPERIFRILEKAFKSTDWDNLEEIRIFKKGAIVVNIAGKKSYISSDFKITGQGKEFVTDEAVLDELVNILTGCSRYAYKECLGSGYLTAGGGHRVGLTGTAVAMENGSYILKDISAVNIRISKDISKFSGSDKALNNLLTWGTTVVISPPKCGKTTFLRRVARQISSENIMISVCIIDEKDEICAVDKGIPFYSTGLNVCIINSMPKDAAIGMMIRNMAPEIIICDEITTEKEAEAVKNAVLSGVNVFFTVHGKNKSVMKEKSFLSCLEGYVDSIVELSGRLGPGTVESIALAINTK